MPLSMEEKREFCSGDLKSSEALEAQSSSKGGCSHVNAPCSGSGPATVYLKQNSLVRFLA